MCGLPEMPGDCSCDKGIAQPVKAIFPQPFLSSYLLINHICLHIVWHGRMKGRVKARNVGHLWKMFMACYHQIDGGLVVSARNQSHIYSGCGLKLTTAPNLLEPQSCGRY